jgi:hypothetical protein
LQALLTHRSCSDKKCREFMALWFIQTAQAQGLIV